MFTTSWLVIAKSMWDSCLVDDCKWVSLILKM